MLWNNLAGNVLEFLLLMRWSQETSVRNNDEVKKTQNITKQNKKTRLAFKHTRIPFIPLLLLRGIKDILVHLLSKRINSMSFCRRLHPYDCGFVSELCRELLHCADWQTCRSTIWHLHYLCILISFSITVHRREEEQA